MVPNRSELKSALLNELYYSGDYSLKTDIAYARIIEYFSGLTDAETDIIYHGTNSKYENSIQFAVKDLKEDGYIIHHSISGHGIWKLSAKGILEGKRLYIETYGCDPHESMEEIIETDIEQIENENNFSEGLKKERLSAYYERKSKIRAKAIDIHGLKCIVCEFDFENTYGELGKGFIEVHHLVPVSSFNDEHNVKPKTDMTVLCANCHRMMHRNRKGVLSVEEPRAIIEKHKKRPVISDKP